jgi:hypothetical protein
VTKGTSMAVKPRAGNRQEPEQDDTAIETAMFDLAASALDDLDLLGLSLVLLAGRNCSPRCSVSTRAHRLRERDFGPLE